jgi:hypothetical protein
LKQNHNQALHPIAGRWPAPGELFVAAALRATATAELRSRCSALYWRRDRIEVAAIVNNP